MRNKIIMIALLAMLIAPVAFAKSVDKDNGFGWTKRINTWSQSIKSWSLGLGSNFRSDDKPEFSANNTEDCVWVNKTVNCSWLNVSSNCSWMNITNCSWLNTTTNCSWMNTTNCSWLNVTTNCSWLNQTVNCSWVNVTINDSVVLVPVNCSWLNQTTNCSWLNQTVNCSWLNQTTNCSWINKTVNCSWMNQSTNCSWTNKTVNCSWSNVSECSGDGPDWSQDEPKVTPGAYRGFSPYHPSLKHTGVGVTGTEGFSEFHIVKFRVIQARKVSPQSIRDLIDSGDDPEEILDYLRNRAVTYWGTMTLGETGYHFEAGFEGDTMSGTLYESIPTNKLNAAMMGRFESETVGNFILTKEIYEGTNLWRGPISVGNETYTNTFIFG